VIAFEPSTRRISVDRLHSSLDGRCAFDTKGGEIQLEKSQELDLRIFLDHSVLEIFINGQEVLTCRVYPTSAEASTISLFAEDGTCEVKRLDYWEMLPMA
jgi:beta-fructofuranosidase